MGGRLHAPPPVLSLVTGVDVIYISHKTEANYILNSVTDLQTQILESESWN